MADTALDRFREAAARAGVEVEVARFPEGTRTAKDAAAAIGCDLAQIVKSLVFMAGERPVLALTSGVNRVDTERLAEEVGSPCRQATADEARAATGYAIGGTPPFGHPEPILTLLDPSLLELDTVWAAAGTPDAVFPIAPSELQRVSGARAVDVTA